MFNGEINARVIRQLCGLAEKLDEQELFEFPGNPDLLCVVLSDEAG